MYSRAGLGSTISGAADLGHHAGMGLLWLPLVLIAVPGGPKIAPAATAPAPMPQYAASIESLDRAFTAVAEPEILLAIAAIYDAWPAHCVESIAAYRRFFKACGTCGALPHGVERFENTITACALDPTAELELRESLLLKTAPKIDRRPGDATREEVAALLREVRGIDPARANELFLTLVEAGASASPVFLNELRAKAWQIENLQDATPVEVHRLLERLREVDSDAHDELLKKVTTAIASKEGLSKLRTEIRDRLQKTTTQPGPQEVEDRVFCRTAPLKEFGFLTIDTRPWSEVYINGEARGSTPLANLKVSAGCNTVLIRNQADGKEVLRNVDIRPNMVTRVFFDLERGQERRTGPTLRD
jgi:hypothetical protein